MVRVKSESDVRSLKLVYVRSMTYLKKVTKDVIETLFPAITGNIWYGTSQTSQTRVKVFPAQQEEWQRDKKKINHIHVEACEPLFFVWSSPSKSIAPTTTRRGPYQYNQA